MTEFTFDLPSPVHVRLVVLDLRGRVVRTLVDGEKSSGRHHVLWNGRDNEGRRVASGIYFYSLRTPGDRRTLRTLMAR